MPPHRVRDNYMTHCFCEAQMPHWVPSIQMSYWVQDVIGTQKIRKLLDLEIQIFETWSPPWAAWVCHNESAAWVCHNEWAAWVCHNEWAAWVCHNEWAAWVWHNEWAGVDMRWFLPKGCDTRGYTEISNLTRHEQKEKSFQQRPETISFEVTHAQIRMHTHTHKHTYPLVCLK